MRDLMLDLTSLVFPVLLTLPVVYCAVDSTRGRGDPSKSAKRKQGLCLEAPTVCNSAVSHGPLVEGCLCLQLGQHSDALVELPFRNQKRSEEKGMRKGSENSRQKRAESQRKKRLHSWQSTPYSPKRDTFAAHPFQRAVGDEKLNETVRQ